MPVIFLTARGEEMDKILGLGLGADDYMVKPFSFAELKARIQAQLRRNYLYKEEKNESDNTLISKDIKLVKDECEVYKNNIKLELSTKEYLILLLLMENEGKVYTKRQIYDSVWKEDFMFDENTVMVHFSNLRSKLDNDGSGKKYITTIRGIGYKWNKDEGKEQLAILVYIYIYSKLTSKYFIRPLKMFSNMVANLEKGNYKERLDINKDDEFGMLAESFNNLADSLENEKQLRKEVEWNSNI